MIERRGPAERRAGVAALVGALLGLPAVAGAATEYHASPDQTRTTQSCLTPATSCALGVAIANVAPAAIGTYTVTLGPGTYDLADINAGAAPGAEPGRLVVPGGATLAGADDRPAPVIVSDAAGSIEAVRAIGGVLRNLTVQRTGSETGVAVRATGLTTPRVPLLLDRISAVSSGAAGVEAQGTVLLRNSMISHTGPGGSALVLDLTPGGSFSTPAPRASGVTALSTGGTGLDVVQHAASAGTYDLVNVLSSSWNNRVTDPGGSIAASVNAVAVMNAPATTGAVTITPVKPVLTVAPTAIDPAGLPAVGSPLLDAGATVDGIGATDLLGGKRITGAAPDIGALERQDGVAPPGDGTGAPPPTPVDDWGTLIGDGFGGDDFPDTLEPWVTVTSKVSKLARSKLLKGFTIKITTDEAAAAKVELVVKTKSKGKTKEKTVGSAEAKATAPGEIKLKLKVKASKAPKKGTKATLRFSLTDAAGNVGRVSVPTKLT